MYNLTQMKTIYLSFYTKGSSNDSFSFGAEKRKLQKYSLSLPNITLHVQGRHDEKM